MLIKTSHPLLFFILLLFSSHLSLSSPIPNGEDVNTLFRLRNHFGNDDPAFRDWGSIYACYWNGVDCNNDDRVDFLSIELGSIIPKILEIPSFIKDLSHLKYLKISSSHNAIITGPIPRAIAQLHNLEHLDLSNNKLTGTIPGFIGDTFKDNLKYLDLSNNELSGEVTQTLGSYEKLTTLKLNNNQLSGLIPTNFNQIKTLEYLDLSSNEFSGPINEKLLSLSKLSYLILHDNQLNGTIPNELGDLSSLKYFDVANNKLCGRIPPKLSKSDACKFTGNKCLCGYPLKPCKSYMETFKNKEHYATDNRVVFTV